MGYAWLLFFGLLGSAAAGAPALPPTPDWSSDQLRAARATAPTDVLVIGYRREVTTSGAPPQVRSGTITLAGDYVDVASGDEHALDDFTLCRSLTWRTGDATFDDESCYAGPAFRLAELANRRMLGAAADAAGLAAKARDRFAPYWAEQELAVQDAMSDPLVATRSAEGTEWRLGDEVVVRTSGGLAFSPAERQAVARYLSRHLDLHPQVRQALLAAGSLPQRIVIERRELGRRSTETISFSDQERRKADYPLPPHLRSALAQEAQAKTIAGAGLRQALLAIAGTAQPPKPGFDALIERISVAAAGGRPMAAFLQFLALTQQYPGEVMADPRADKLRPVVSAVRTAAMAPDVAALNEASTLAGSTAPSPRREAAARYLARATALDALPFGTFRYVTFANLVRTSGDVGGWDKSIVAHMPPLPDCYWTHIAAYPWASPAFKDLGDLWYSRYDMAKAWQAWDLGRAVDPGWRGGPLRDVADAESRIRQSVPANF